MLANQAANYLVGGDGAAADGQHRIPTSIGYQVFAVADGYLALAIGNDAQFRRCCRVMGLDDLAANPAYATNGAARRPP